MESPSAVRLNRTDPYPSNSTFLIFCGNSLLSAANDLITTFPFSGQAKTVAYKSFLVWVKRISCAVALLYAPSLNPCALILISASAIVNSLFINIHPLTEFIQYLFFFFIKRTVGPQGNAKKQITILTYNINQQFGHIRG